MASNRQDIEKVVRQNPGISFTELKNETGCKNGVLQYHIRQSARIEKKKAALIPKNYCIGCNFKDLCNQNCTLKELRKQKTTNIIRFLSEGRKQSEIAEKLELDKSTVSYHVNKLREMNILEGDKVHKKVESVV